MLNETFSMIFKHREVLDNNVVKNLSKSLKDEKFVKVCLHVGLLQIDEIFDEKKIRFFFSPVM